MPQKRARRGKAKAKSKVKRGLRGKVKHKREGKRQPAAAVALASAPMLETTTRDFMGEDPERYVRRAIKWALCGRDDPYLQPVIPENAFDRFKAPKELPDFRGKPLERQTWSFAFDKILELLAEKKMFPKGLRENEADYQYPVTLEKIGEFLVARI